MNLGTCLIVSGHFGHIRDKFIRAWREAVPDRLFEIILLFASHFWYLIRDLWHDIQSKITPDFFEFTALRRSKTGLASIARPA